MAVVTISTAQNGGKVAVRAGDSITLRLPENPATGYRWTFSSLGVEGDRRANRFEGGGAGVGGGGQAVWTLRARAAGSTRIALKHWRPWEGDRSVVERFEVSLGIAPGGAP